MKVISFDTHPILTTIISLVLMFFLMVPIALNWQVQEYRNNERYKAPTEYRRNIDEK